MSAPQDVTVFVCGGESAKRCPAGGEHDDLGRVVLYGPTGKPCGESVTCSKCGSSAFDRDMLELP